MTSRNQMLSGILATECVCIVKRCVSGAGALPGALLLATIVLVLDAAGSRASQHVLVVVGDSLSAGYGIETNEGWVQLLAERLRDRVPTYEVINASISGETTRGGLDRIAGVLAQHQPEVVIIELGGNDGLRGIAPTETSKNLRGVTQQSIASGARVLLVGMELPPNLGRAYIERFKAIYTDLSVEFNVPLVPFLLEGVALEPSLMQSDGIHPNADAQSTLLENVWPYLEPVLE